MRKFLYQRRFELIITAVLAAVAFKMLFVYPVVGIADNGDFIRAMLPFGFTDQTDVFELRYFNFLKLQYNIISPPIFLSIRKIMYLTSQLAPVGLAKLLNIMFYSKDVFDIRFLAAIYYAVLLFAGYHIVRQSKSKNMAFSIVVVLWLILVVCDANYIAYFNTFYSEAFAYVCILAAIAFALRIINTDKPKKIDIICLFLVLTAFCTSKPQYSILSFIIAISIVLIHILKGYRFRKSIIMVSVLIVVISMSVYMVTPKNISKDTLYNSVFYGILKDSPNPKEAAKSLGLDEKFEKYAGTHRYVYVSSQEDDNEFFANMSQSKVIKYYATHPGDFIRKMELTANKAFDHMASTNLENNYNKQDKLPLPGNKIFTAYHSAKRLIPHTLWFIIPFYILLFAILVVLYRKSKDINKKCLLIIMAAISIMGLVQFPMPILANGEADIGKQLFMFDVTFDISLFFLIGVLAHSLSGKIAKCFKKS